MVAEHVTVKSRAFGSEEAWCWESSGADGYTITPCEKEQAGTDIIIKLKEDSEEEKYGQFLDPYRIENLVKKYSDYIRYPIRMEMERSRMKERPADAPKDAPPEWETYTEVSTLNSMIPLWQRGKSEASEEELNTFYKEKFGDYMDPVACIRTSVEGAVTYQSLLYVPARAPYDFYTRDYVAGLQLYSSGVLIMRTARRLLPTHIPLCSGRGDSQDFSLNIRANASAYQVAENLGNWRKTRPSCFACSGRQGKVSEILGRVRPPSQIRCRRRFRDQEGTASRPASLPLHRSGSARLPRGIPFRNAGRAAIHLLRNGGERTAHLESAAGGTDFV